MPYGWAEHRWSKRAPDEIMDELLEAVDLVYESKAMDQVGAESGVDTRQLLWSFFQAA